MSADRSSTPTTRLLVVRHGRSEWNTLGRWQGHADIALDRTGELQAVAAAEVLGQFDAIWASDLARAHRTAQIVAELLGVGPVRTDVRLRERDVGPWEGLTHQEVERGWPGFLQERRRPDGFEDEEPAATRMLAAFVDIAAEHPGGEVLVVSHGGVIRAAQRAAHAPSAPHVPNLSGAWFEVRGDQVRAGEIVHLLVEESDVAEAL
jgi:probable phosphoglycerate mutase